MRLRYVFWALVAGLFAYEGVTLLNAAPGDTISEIMWAVLDRPLAAFALGMLLGHLVWPRHIKEVKPMRFLILLIAVAALAGVGCTKLDITGPACTATAGGDASADGGAAGSNGSGGAGGSASGSGSASAGCTPSEIKSDPSVV